VPPGTGAGAPGPLGLLGNCWGIPPGGGASPPDSPSTGVRITTGGIGREPGMLIRIRVVSVVSVLRSRRPFAPAFGPGPAAAAPPVSAESPAAPGPYGP
jgi:hypothetical protein